MQVKIWKVVVAYFKLLCQLLFGKANTNKEVSERIADDLTEIRTGCFPIASYHRGWVAVTPVSNLGGTRFDSRSGSPTSVFVVLLTSFS